MGLAYPGAGWRLIGLENPSIYLAMAISACLRVWNDICQMHSAFRVVKNVSTTALSQQLPRPFIEIVKPRFLSSP